MHSPSATLLLLLKLLGLVAAVLTAKLVHHDAHHSQHDQSGQHSLAQQRAFREGRTLLTRGPPPPPPVRILELSNQRDNDGSFQYGFQAANRIQATVEGHQKVIGDGIGTVMQGHYSYVSPEGHPVRVRWTADERGFKAFADDLGLPPPQP